MPYAKTYHGRVSMGRHVEVAAPTLKVPCSKCDAEIGERCRMWRKQGGVRLYVKGYTTRHHEERKALRDQRRAAGEL